MQALKGLVVGLGILIVVSFILLIYGFYTKILGPGDATSPAVADDVPAPPVAGLGEVRVTLPTDCVVEEMSPDGQGSLFLRLGPDGSCRRILVVDVKSGRQVGVIMLGQ